MKAKLCVILRILITPQGHMWTRDEREFKLVFMPIGGAPVGAGGRDPLLLQAKEGPWRCPGLCHRVQCSGRLNRTTIVCENECHTSLPTVKSVTPPIITVDVSVQLTSRWSMRIDGDDFLLRVRQSKTVQCQSSSVRFVASPHTR